MTRHSLYILIAAVTLLASCDNRTANGGGGDTIRLKYSRLLTMVRHKGYTKVSVADPWHDGRPLHTYILVDRKDSARATSLPAGTVVYTPVKRSVIFNSAYCRLLQDLRAEEAIKGVCDLKYIINPQIQAGVRDGSIADCGNGLLPAIEKIIELRPQALLVPPFDNNGGYGKLEKIGIPIIECADYMEVSCLARAEWMKFYGLLFGRERQVDSLFNVMDTHYRSLRDMARRLPRGRSVITERKTGSVWYCPGGESTMGRLIADANGLYAFAGDKHSGSLALPFEKVLNEAGNSDVWMFTFDGSKPLSRSDLLAEYNGYKALKAFRTGEIYECNSAQKPYFDNIAFHPDYLLCDFILILHPQVKGKLRYYTRLVSSH